MNVALVYNIIDKNIEQFVKDKKLGIESEFKLIRVQLDIMRNNYLDLLDELQRNNISGIIIAGNNEKHFTESTIGRKFILDLINIGINRNHIIFTPIYEFGINPHTKQSDINTKIETLIMLALIKIKHSQPENYRDVEPVKAIAILGISKNSLILTRLLMERNIETYLIDTLSSNDILEKYYTSIESDLEEFKNKNKISIFPKIDIDNIYGWTGNYILRYFDGFKYKDIHFGGMVLDVEHNSYLKEYLHHKLHLEFDCDGNYRHNFMDTTFLTSDDGVCIIDNNNNSNNLTNISQHLSTLLNKDYIKNPIHLSHVNNDVCSGCGVCIKVCIFGATSIETKNKVSEVSEFKCKGCGNCVSACPTGARDLFNNTNLFLSESINAISQVQEYESKKTLVFLCSTCGYSAAIHCGTMELKYSVDVVPITIQCVGRLDTQFILEAFRKGIKGVFIGMCKIGSCNNIIGNIDLERRITLLKEALVSRKIDPERVRIVEFSYSDGKRFATKLNQFTDSL